MYKSNQAERSFFFIIIIFLVVEINSGDKYFVCKFVIFFCKESFMKEYYKLVCLKYVFTCLREKRPLANVRLKHSVVNTYRHKDCNK